MTSCRLAGSAASDLDAFLELLCADEELLRAEFEAIVAAVWPRPPDRRAVVQKRTWGRTAARLPAGAGLTPAGRPSTTGSGVDAWARQRSPPGH